MGKNKTIFFNVLSVVLVKGITFFTAPIFSRLLGAHNYGIVSVYLSWVGVITIVFPLCVTSTIGIATKEFPAHKQHEFQSSALVLGISSYLAFSAIALIMIDWVRKITHMDKTLIYIAIVAGFFGFIINFANSRYVFEFKANINFLISVSSLLVSIALCVGLIWNMDAEINYFGRILGGVISNAFFGLILAAVILKDGKMFYNAKYWRFCIPIAVPVIFHALSNTALSQSDRIMIQRMLDNSSAGIYSLAYNFTAILTTLYSALNDSWIPFYYKYLSDEDTGKVIQHGDHYVELYTVVAGGFLMLFPEVYRVFAGREYWDGIDYIPMIVIGCYAMFLYSLSVNFEFYCKKTKYMAFITASAAGINILLNYLLISKLGAWGAALATAVSYGYEVVVHYIFARYFCGREFPFQARFYIKHLLHMTAILALFYIFQAVWIVRWSIGAWMGVYIICKIIRRRTIF